MTWMVCLRGCCVASTHRFPVITPWTCECWSRQCCRSLHSNDRTQSRSSRCQSSSSESRSTSQGVDISSYRVCSTMRRVQQVIALAKTEQILNCSARSNSNATSSTLCYLSHNTPKARLIATSRRYQALRCFLARRPRRCLQANRKLVKTWSWPRLQQSPIQFRLQIFMVPMAMGSIINTWATLMSTCLQLEQMASSCTVGKMAAIT